MSVDLPAPPTPADCDLRGLPLPLDLFIEMAVVSFGVPAAEAEAMVRAAAARMGVPVSEVGHG